MRLRTGDTVKWQWSSGEGSGKVKDIFWRRVTRTLKGSKITRVGTADNPAVLIEQENGDEVLKLASELS